MAPILLILLGALALGGGLGLVIVVRRELAARERSRVRRTRESNGALPPVLSSRTRPGRRS